MRLKDKVAVVTGAAQGIGLAIAERFAREGAKVTIGDINVEKGEAAAAKLGAGALFHQADVGYRDQAEGLIARAVAAFGRLDILVNNAGITHNADFLDLAEDDYDRVLRTNLKSVFLCGQAAARRMVAQGGGGTIINMASVNAPLAIPNQVPYGASKGAINQLTRVMAVGLAPHRIRVNAIGPGTIMTDLARDSVLRNETATRMVMSRTPIGRFGEPDEVASVALFLASDDASYITGQTIYPDGGRLALNYTVPVAP
ncbi:MAG TPA: SDR family oxidoreductase [Beijerinckiaceae bacterium]|nr:SDR family oxidoreductase [Beijerinckiaceae bacterium]